MAMPRKIYIFTLLLLTQFLYVQIAEAGLVRSGGRGSLSRNFDQAFYYVDNQYLNEVGIMESAWIGASSNFISRAVGGGGRGLGSVPRECIKGYVENDVLVKDEDIQFLQDDFDNGTITQSELDDGIARLEAGIAGEPCVWEFKQGEALSTFGFFNLYFGTPDVTYDVNWKIEGTETFDLSGSVNTAGSLDTPDGIIPNGSVTLNTSAPVNLIPGDYLLYVSVSLSSTEGKFFWENGDGGNEVEIARICKENPEWVLYSNNPALHNDPNVIEPEMDICGYNSVELFTTDVFDSPTFFSSEPERLRIVAANSNPITTPVNAPAPLGIFLLGLGTIMLRRRKK
jgi:hypothetical protein